MISHNMDKIFRIHDKLYVGLNGLPTDVQTMYVHRVSSSIPITIHLMNIIFSSPLRYVALRPWSSV